MTLQNGRETRRGNMETCNEGTDQIIPDNNTIPRKSWSELKGVVSELRRKLSGVSTGSVPGSITFRSLADGR